MSKVVMKVNHMKAFKKSMKELARNKVKIGVLQKEFDSEHKDGDLTVGAIATIHEFGAPAANIPQRSFLRSTQTDQKSAVTKFLVNAARKSIPMSPNEGKKELDRLGLWFVAKVQAKIRAGIAPELKEATKIQKGGNKDTPLIRSSQLVKSITHKVESS